MPVSINTAALKYRDQQGTYQPIASIKGDNGAIGVVASAYEDLTYPVTTGQGCIYNDLYYVAKQNIATQEEWTSAHWEQKSINEEINDLKDSIPSVPVTDIQINGTTIVSNGVANIPVCSSSTFGVVKIDANSFGIKINESGRLYTDTPSLIEIKAGTQAYKPIVPANIHSATFYGLAKAAGDTTQALSTNAVGTYTEDAKTAIKTMLGIAGGVTGIPNPSTKSAGDFLIYNGTEWVAQTVATWQGGNY